MREERFMDGVRAYWETTPCGSTTAEATPGSREWFAEIERVRYEREPEIHAFAQFTRWRGRRVLEVGCGLGTDLVQFARAGARVVGLDYTHEGTRATAARLRAEGLPGVVVRGNAEALLFADESFDLVYSWGVIHHTEFPERAIDEVRRVLKPGGEARIMLYNRRSFCVLWLMLAHAGKGWPDARHLLAKYMESPGTKAYTVDEVRRMFGRFQDVTVDRVFSHYDLPRFPPWSRLVPQAAVRAIGQRFGWFLTIRAVKPR